MALVPNRFLSKSHHSLFSIWPWRDYRSLRALVFPTERRLVLICSCWCFMSLTSKCGGSVHASDEGNHSRQRLVSVLPEKGTSLFQRLQSQPGSKPVPSSSRSSSFSLLRVHCPNVAKYVFVFSWSLLCQICCVTLTCQIISCLPSCFTLMLSFLVICWLE